MFVWSFTYIYIYISLTRHQPSSTAILHFEHFSFGSWIQHHPQTWSLARSHGRFALVALIGTLGAETWVTRADDLGRWMVGSPFDGKEQDGISGFWWDKVILGAKFVNYVHEGYRG